MVDWNAKFFLLLVGIVVVTLLVVFSKSEPRRLRKSVPLQSAPPMGRINIPCDPELLGEYVKALSKERIQFLPPAEPEAPMPYPYGSYHRENRCFILVADEDLQRAEQIIAEVDRKFYL